VNYTLASLSVFWAIWLLATNAQPAPSLHLQAATPPLQLEIERLTPQQLLISGTRLDINQATEAQLVALPEIGEGLARAILAARTQGPLACWAALENIPGIGSRRARRVAPFLRPLPRTCPERHQTR